MNIFSFCRHPEYVYIQYVCISKFVFCTIVQNVVLCEFPFESILGVDIVDTHKKKIAHYAMVSNIDEYEI